MFDVITIGDLTRDIFLFPYLEEVEKPLSGEEIECQEPFEKYLVFGLGDKIAISDVQFSVGGTAANMAVGLTKTGLKCGLISAVGADSIGTELLQEIKNRKVTPVELKVRRGRKSSFAVIISYKGERTIFVYHAFQPADLNLPKELNTRWVFLGPMAEGFERIYNSITGQVIQKQLKVAVNPGSIQIKHGLESFGGLKSLIEIIFLNREEAAELSGLKGVAPVKDVAQAIHLRGPKIVVITDGKEGAYACADGVFLKVGPYPGHRLDATGAGDAFASGFLSAYIHGAILQECLKWGVVNSASVIEKIGAEEGLLSHLTIKKRIKEYRWRADSLQFA